MGLSYCRRMQRTVDMISLRLTCIDALGVTAHFAWAVQRVSLSGRSKTLGMALGPSPTLTGHMYSHVRYALTSRLAGRFCFCSSQLPARRLFGPSTEEF